MPALTIRLIIDLAALRQQRDLLLLLERAATQEEDAALLEGLVNLADVIIDEYLQAYPEEADEEDTVAVRRVPVLCGCGWGSLGMPEDEVPDECPVCGGPLGH